MKRATALKYCQEISRRVHGANGLLATPLCSHEAARISRIWVFGSTAKGSESPNDLDLLIEINNAGRYRTWRQTRIDKRYERSYGMKSSPDSTQYALKWLTKGMKMVSRHTTHSESAELDVKTLVYPRYEMKTPGTTKVEPSAPKQRKFTTAKS